MALNPKQVRFVAEYLVDLNATQAAIRAGYRPRAAKQQGHRLLTNADVQAAVTAAQAQRAHAVEVDAGRVLKELAAVAFSDLGQMFEITDTGVRIRPGSLGSEEIRRALAAIKVRRVLDPNGGPPQEIVEFRLWDKVQALHKLGQHLGLFVEKHEHSGAITQTHLYIPDNGRTEKS